MVRVRALPPLPSTVQNNYSHVTSRQEGCDIHFRLKKYGLKPVMLKINPDLKGNSSNAEKYAAFVEAVVTRRVIVT